MQLLFKNIRSDLLRIFILSAFTLFLTGCPNGGSNQSASEMLLKIQTSYASIADLVISIAYLAGAIFVVKGIFSFKQYGEQRTMMSSQTTIKVPLTYFCVGIALLFMPKMISIASNAAFMQPTINILGYRGGPDDFENIKTAVFGLVQVVGLISVLRAFFIAGNPHPSSGQGGMGKAAIHFFGGLAALNIQYMVKLLSYYV